MPFDESLAARVRLLLRRRRGFSEKKMFGGVGFLLNGNMCVGVWKEFLIVRVGPDAYDDALAEPGVREFDITGRSMTGWVMVEPDGVESERKLSEWVQQAVDFVEGLPKK
jgi:TfoX/Sxy family transcriptional regulator of competence genes